MGATCGHPYLGGMVAPYGLLVRIESLPLGHHLIALGADDVERDLEPGE